MNISRCFSDAENFRETFIEIDLLPDTAISECQNWIGQGGSRTIGNLLSSRLPKRMAATVLELAGVEGTIRQAELSKKAVAALVTHTKSLPVPVHGTRGYPKAEVTAGGVSLNEVNFQTMESRLLPGLFLAGEILDLDGPIGGYNFQAAWSTGHVAGQNL